MVGREMIGYRSMNLPRTRKEDHISLFVAISSINWGGNMTPVISHFLWLTLNQALIKSPEGVSPEKMSIIVAVNNNRIVSFPRCACGMTRWVGWPSG